jgi:DNA-binding TFAR19-related protein (PDSD5 family)
MDTEDLLPRVALAATIVAAAYIYRQRRGNKMKQVTASVAAAPESGKGATEPVAALAARSQGILEGVLDNVAEEALKQLKVVLKDGLQRLEKAVDDL